MSSLAGHSRRQLRTKLQPVLYEPVLLDEAMTARTALLKVVRALCNHFFANLDCVRQDGCPESVHQLRIGVRRARVILSDFSGVMEDEEVPSLLDELRWFQRQLGPAREWDVTLDEILVPLWKGKRLSIKARGVIQIANAHRIVAHKDLQRSLNSARCRAFLKRLEQWKEILESADRRSGTAVGHAVPGWNMRSKKLARPVMDLASEALQARHAKVRKLGNVAHKLKEKELHKLRIELKELRYTAELFYGLWGNKKERKLVSAYLAGVKKLQVVLGVGHDIAIAGKLIRSIRSEAESVLKREIDEIRDQIAEEHKGDYTPLDKLWKRHARAKKFWETR